MMMMAVMATVVLRIGGQRHNGTSDDEQCHRDEQAACNLGHR